MKSRQWKSEERLFRTVMELGRRYKVGQCCFFFLSFSSFVLKVLNPDRMRTEYGRLMYLMMDAARNDVEQLLGFKVRAPMVTGKLKCIRVVCLHGCVCSCVFFERKGC